MSYEKLKANKPFYYGSLRNSIQHIGGQETYNNRKLFHKVMLHDLQQGKSLY